MKKRWSGWWRMVGVEGGGADEVKWELRVLAMDHGLFELKDDQFSCRRS